MNNNLLISCSGKQFPLVKSFKDALKGQGKIVVADNNKYTPAMSIADYSLVSPKLSDEKYADWCLEICEKYNIGLWITFLEYELLILEDYRSEMYNKGCILLGAPKKNIIKALDKYSYKKFLNPYGILVPETWTLKELKNNEFLKEGKYIIKNRYGRGSKGIERVENLTELYEIVKNKKYSENWIIQPIIEGDEYCIDIVNDLENNFVTSLIKKRYIMGINETDVSETIKDDDIDKIARKVSKAIKHMGSIDVEMIRNKKGIYVVDINVRFGGAYIFSHMAGANIPSAIIAWKNGVKPDTSWLNHNTGEIWSRYTTLIKYKPNNIDFK